MSKLQLASIALSKGGKSALKSVLGKSVIKSVTAGGIENETIQALTFANINSLRKRVKGEVVFAEGVDQDGIKDARAALDQVSAEFNSNTSLESKRSVILGAVAKAIDDGNCNLDIKGSCASDRQFVLKLKKNAGLSVKDQLAMAQAEIKTLKAKLK